MRSTAHRALSSRWPAATPLCDPHQVLADTTDDTWESFTSETPPLLGANGDDDEDEDRASFRARVASARAAREERIARHSRAVCRRRGTGSGGAAEEEVGSARHEAVGVAGLPERMVQPRQPEARRAVRGGGGGTAGFARGLLTRLGLNSSYEETLVVLPQEQLPPGLHSDPLPHAGGEDLRIVSEACTTGMTRAFVWHELNPICFALLRFGWQLLKLSSGRRFSLTFFSSWARCSATRTATRLWPFSSPVDLLKW